MTNKFKDFHNVDSDYFNVLKNPDYCSFCGGWISKMVNHNTAHRLKHRLFRESIPNDPNENMELMNSYFWYSQDKSKPEHLRPHDPRLDEYLKKEQKLKERKNLVSK